MAAAVVAGWSARPSGLTPVFLLASGCPTLPYRVDQLISADITHRQVLSAEVSAQCQGEAQGQPPRFAVDHQGGHPSAAQLISCQPGPADRIRTVRGPAVCDEYQQRAAARVAVPLESQRFSGAEQTLG